MNNDRYLLRGKRVDNGEWVEGFIVQNEIETGIARVNNVPPLDKCEKESWLDEFIKGFKVFEVIPETVGQCTGLKDKEGKFIFEGDVLQREEEKSFRRTNDNYLVQWSHREHRWVVECYNGELKIRPSLSIYSDYKIIGTIHDEDN